MRKKIISIALFTLFILLFTSCGKKTVNLTDYLEVSFEGLNTNGTVNYYVEDVQAIAEAYGIETVDFESEMMTLYEKKPETAAEINELFSSYSVTIDKEDELSNGDTITVTITVDEDIKTLKGGEKEFTVEGLEEPEIIKSEDVKKHIIVDFIGANERGQARIENTFNNELANVPFKIEDDGKLTNGKQAKLIVDEEDTLLIDYGYKLEDDFEVTYDIEGLTEFAKDVSDIKNYKDIKQMIDEEKNKNYADSDWDILPHFDVKEEVVLYRQFNNEDEDEGFYTDYTETHGSLVVLYTVTTYRNKTDKQEKNVDQEFIAAIGYRNLALDDKGNVNVSKMINTFDEEDSSYSLNTIKQIYEGNGYEVVNKK